MGVLPVGDASCKPHKPVRMYIRARPRTMTIRTLKSIGTFEAVLPHGPPKKPQYMAGEEELLSLNQKFDLFTTKMEEEITGLLPLSEEALKSMVGRTEGPRFVQRCALGMKLLHPEGPRPRQGPGGRQLVGLTMC